jgi:hypothetical protein
LTTDAAQFRARFYGKYIADYERELDRQFYHEMRTIMQEVEEPFVLAFRDAPATFVPSWREHLWRT